MFLFIEEEYGYREWIAELTAAEWEALQERWRAMRGLNPLVPVTLIIPQAKLIEWEEFGAPDYGRVYKEAAAKADDFAHVHDCDDSVLAGVPCDPTRSEDDAFTIDGRTYSREELLALLRG